MAPTNDENQCVSASNEDVEILEPETDCDVHTDEGGERPSRKGKQNRFLRHQSQVNAAKGFEHRKEVIRLHVFEGHSLRETAEIMGIAHRTAQKHWTDIVRETKGSGSPEEMRDEVRAFADLQLREVVQAAQGLVGDAAAYGAVVVQAVKTLCELHGVEPPEEKSATTLTMEEIGRQVRSKSPLLLEKLEHIQTARRARQDGGAE